MKTENIYKIPVFAAMLTVLITVPLRIYQYFKIVDPETGFYNKTDASVYIIYALLAVACLISIFIPVAGKKKLQTVSACKKSTGFFIASLIMSVTIIYDSANVLLSYFDLYTEGASLGNLISVTEYVRNQGGTMMLIQVVFGALSAIFFFITGISVGVGNSDGSKLKILALSPTVWSIFKLLYRFKRTISFTNVSDLLFELFLIVFMMLYFFSFAQVISKIDSDTVFYKTISYGVPAIIFAAICFIPRFILTVSGNKDLLCSHYIVNYSDFGFIIFASYNIITRIKTKASEENQ